MKVDIVMTLENDINCLLLEKATLEDKNYFLSVVLTEAEEPSDEYIILQELIEDDGEYVIKVTDEPTLAKLVNLFTIDLSNTAAGISKSAI